MTDTPRIIAETTDIAAGDVPLTCRWPQDTTPKGMVLFCHGLGGSGARYRELSRAWAAAGYLVVHPTFPDAIASVAAAEPALGLDPAADLSDWAAAPAIRARMHQILLSPEYWLARLRIVSTIMGHVDAVLAATAAPPPLSLPCAIAGHSFGAYTAQLLAGAEIDLPGRPAQRFVDPRFTAAILLSAQGRDQQGLREGSWSRLTIPALTVTGTLDRGAGGQDWRWKSEPFHLGPPGGKYLAVLDDADHYLGGIDRPGRPTADPVQFTAVARLATAFLDAHLAGDEAALAWLKAVDDQVAGCSLHFERR